MTTFKLEVLARPLDKEDRVIIHQALMLFIGQTQAIQASVSANELRPDGLPWPKKTAPNAQALESRAKHLLRTQLASFKAN